MVVEDASGRVTEINDAALSLLGYTRDEMVSGAVCWRELTPSAWRDADRRDARTLREGGTTAPRRKEFVHHDGHSVPVLLSAATVDVGEPETISFVLDRTDRERADRTPATRRAERLVSGDDQDVTERRRTEDALKTANSDLEAFSYSVAHDLRAPLRGMSGFAQVLLDTYGDKFDAEGTDWLREILLNARKMGALIDALLSLGRVTRTELHAERVDLTALAGAVLVRLSRADPSRTVEITIAPDLTADLDPHLAHVLFENLLENAWKFSGRTTAARIEIGASDAHGERTFFVRDNGAGFDMAFAQKLFAPFQRLHTVREFPGTGIGLATAQRIVHRHGGHIWAEGSVGHGATIFFTLPGGATGDSPWAK